MCFGQQGKPVCPNFIGSVPIGGHPVTADKDSFCHSLLHDHGSHAVCDKSHINACLLELPCRQPCALKERPRFICIHF
ncbi:Uncharacterised protein [Mycobacteroides abscessus subsp. abscessus]|nr:Uncharacterised protein [Mycobacteroides abscessus subsp. abscessus]